jgi:serine/threonine protein phosphatase PrpC
LDGELGELPAGCEALLPPLVARFTDGDRAYVVFETVDGTALAELEPVCRESDVVALLHRLARGLSDLAALGLDLSSLSADDVFLDDDRPVFQFFPLLAPEPENPSELFHAWVKFLCFKRLEPQKTRNLERPLACLCFSEALEQTLAAFLASELSFQELKDFLATRQARAQADWDVYGTTDTGMVRDHNEDGLLWQNIARATFLGQSHWHLLAVSDGMGGHARGEVASHLSLAHWQHFLLERFVSAARPVQANPRLVELLNGSFDTTAEQLWQDEALDTGAFSMDFRPGATLVAGLLDGRLLVLGNCGDSRAYLIMNGGIRQLTKDHSLVQLYVDRGDLTKEEARGHEHGNIITSFMGIDRKSFKKDVSVWYLPPGSTLLLCSDGLSDMLRDEQILAEVEAASDARTAVARLIECANDAGGEDNVTVLVARDRNPQTHEDDAAEPDTAGEGEEP